MKLNKNTRKFWFLDACYKGKPIMNKHHIIPKHHGGEDSDLVEVTVEEHALLHLKIYQDTGCKTCYKSYKTLMGQHNEWVRVQNLFDDNIDYDILDYDKDQRDMKHENKNSYTRVNFYEPMDYSDSVSDVIDLEAEDLIYEETENTTKEDVTLLLDTLKNREREVLKMFFGIDRDFAIDIEVIGEKYNLTRERIRQIKDKAIKRLRYRSEIKENYLTEKERENVSMNVLQKKLSKFRNLR